MVSLSHATANPSTRRNSEKKSHAEAGCVGPVATLAPNVNTTHYVHGMTKPRMKRCGSSPVVRQAGEGPGPMPRKGPPKATMYGGKSKKKRKKSLPSKAAQTQHLKSLINPNLYA